MRLEGKGHGWQLQGQKMGSPQNYQPHQQPQPETKAGQGGKQRKQPEGRQNLGRQRKVAREMKRAQREERQRGR